jgi:hypothetical protein
MIGTKISNGTALGNAFAFITPLCFTTIVIIIRKLSSNGYGSSCSAYLEFFVWQQELYHE